VTGFVVEVLIVVVGTELAMLSSLVFEFRTLCMLHIHRKYIYLNITEDNLTSPLPPTSLKGPFNASPPLPRQLQNPPRNMLKPQIKPPPPPLTIQPLPLQTPTLMIPLRLKIPLDPIPRHQTPQHTDSPNDIPSPARIELDGFAVRGVQAWVVLKGGGLLGGQGGRVGLVGEGWVGQAVRGQHVFELQVGAAGGARGLAEGGAEDALAGVGGRGGGAEDGGAEGVVGVAAVVVVVAGGVGPVGEQVVDGRVGILTRGGSRRRDGGGLGGRCCRGALRARSGPDHCAGEAALGGPGRGDACGRCDAGEGAWAEQELAERAGAHGGGMCGFASWVREDL
jgi:hypothetical protein